MCAIAGILGLPYDEGVIQGMLETMKRRGPDGNGIYSTDQVCLLHSRLAIIDPENGKQPMGICWKGQTYITVYNGELYNTDEIRTELRQLGHSFSSHSDTEVLCHAYAQWGEACLEKLNGIFAFGVWEQEKRRLFLARDRIGVKPLFYTNRPDGFLFASEIKTILCHPMVEAELDSEGIAQLIMLGPGRIPGSGVLRNICELEPGCCGYYEHGMLRLKRYWKLTDREHTEDFESTAEHVRYLVEDSIHRQMVSDVPIGTFLSGGLDSSLISSVCNAKQKDTGNRLLTFSVGYKDNDKYFIPGKFQPNSDDEYISIMQKYLGSEHHLTVLTPYDLMNAMEESLTARDLPGMADVDISLAVFCKDIRSRVKVALSGECADEIFGGYPWYRDPEIRAVEGFPWAQNTQYRHSFLSDSIKGKINCTEFVQDNYSQTIKECDILNTNSPEEKRMKQMVNLNFRWFMQTLLDRKDRMSMYHGLEVRVPFCDYRIAEYLYGVPWSFKDHNGVEKGLLRYAMSSHLPDQVLNRKKSPYPKTHDPLYMQLVSEQLRNMLSQKDAPIFEIVSRRALENLLHSQPQWPWYGQLMRVPQTICYMLQLELWLRKYKVRIV